MFLKKIKPEATFIASGFEIFKLVDG